MTLSQAVNISLIVNLGHKGNGLVETMQNANVPTEYQGMRTDTSSGY